MSVFFSLFNSSINVLLVVVVVSVSVSVSVIYDDDGRVGLLWFTSWYEWVSSDHPPSILLSVVSTPSPEWMREKDKQAEIDCGRHGIPCYWLVCWIAIIRPRSSSTQMRTNSVAINDDYRVCVCVYVWRTRQIPREKKGTQWINEWMMEKNSKAIPRLQTRNIHRH